MSNFLNVSVLVLATMVLVLAGMVGYMYWQQSKVIQTVSSLSAFITNQFVPPVLDHDSEDEEEEEDDRASVEEEKEVEVVEKVEVPTTKNQEPDVDDLQTKTSVELRELLSKKGIPYGKRDSKSVLLQLLKATA
jgi:flagellar basal body-associated protein FliL